MSRAVAKLSEQSVAMDERIFRSSSLFPSSCALIDKRQLKRLKDGVTLKTDVSRSWTKFRSGSDWLLMCFDQ